MAKEPKGHRASGLDGIPPPWERPEWSEIEQARAAEGEEGEGDGLALWRERIALERGPSLRVCTFKVTPNKEKLESMTKLKAARKRVKELGAVVRGDAFEDWLAQGVVTAQTPAEWTQAAILYASYLRHAARYGNNRGDKRLAKQELATETAWGKMMGSLFNKKRRRAGQYYPVRLKRGA